jgi:hypothetical protein
MRRRLAVTIVLSLLATGPGQGRAADGLADSAEFFEKRVRPILVENCHKCHASDKKKGNLQLDSREKLLKGGDSGRVIVPGQPEKSLLIKAIRYGDDVLRMPPKGKLADSQIADLTTWIKLGAPWSDQPVRSSRTNGSEVFDLRERRKHWAWQPLKNCPPPAVRRTDWPQSPIDYFVLAKLEANGMAPAKPADKRTLIRRVTYDLLGLPPTVAEIDAFLADEAPDAYAKLIDRLLASEHYGERWARHWLDLVRFAETCGHEYDFELPDASSYRDYVIRALNADVPYDQFVREHIAGDLLPSPRRHPTGHYNESILGTGFWFLGEAKHSPVDIRADEAERIDNQIDVLAKTFLGLTVSCARCHDHKFDAITSKDYYALAGYLESSRYQRAFLDDPERNRPVIRELQKLHAQSRDLGVAITARDLEKRAKDLASHLIARPISEWGDLAPDHPFYPWVVLARDPGRGAKPFAARHHALVHELQLQRESAVLTFNRSVVFAGSEAKTFQDWFVTGEAFGNQPTRTLEAVLRPDQRHPVQSILMPGMVHSGLVSNRLQGALRSQTFVLSKGKILYHVAGRQAQINLIIDGYQQIRDPIYGGLTVKIDHGDRLEWRVQDVRMWQGHRAYIEILDEGPGYAVCDKVLFSDDRPPVEAPNGLILRMLDDPGITSPSVLAGKYQDLCLEILEQWHSGLLGSASDAAERVALLNFILQSDLFAGWVGSNRQGLADLFERQKQFEAGLPAARRALAMADGTAWNEPVHIRGNHKILGQEVPRRFLEALVGNLPPPTTGSGRLALAEQVVGPSNPLLPRVMVNRLWQHHFGEGIVRSVDNFGALGERPTHAELLDYLAREFVRSGWSIKKMHRLMLLSATYQMSSQADMAAETADPQNNFLNRMPVRRLEAELIRDAILAVSGRLDHRMYGPSVAAYLTPHMAGRGRPATSGPLDGDGRRSIYLSVRRNFLTPMFLAFDYPIPFTTIGRRSQSNVPGQALALMNNPFVMQQAELWARRVLAKEGASAEQRIANMYVDAFGRPPSAAELAEALAFLVEQSKNYQRSEDPRAWADLAHVLFNVKEFIFLN